MLESVCFVNKLVSFKICIYIILKKKEKREIFKKQRLNNWDFYKNKINTNLIK